MTPQTRSAELAQMSDEEFIEELNNNMGNFTSFHPFTTGANSDRTRDALRDMVAKVDGDMIKFEHAAGTDPDWILRAKGFRRIAERCLGQLKHQDEIRNRKHGAELRAWRAFAHQLCEVVEAGLPFEALDDIPMPYFDGMTARQWFDRRLEKRGLLDTRMLVKS